MTVFDDGYPGVANLDPDLLQALREAATDAADDGVKFYVNSGWRSPERQNQLLREAVSKYGSEDGSRPMGGHRGHVSSRVGGRDRHRALQCHGVAVRARAEYGLCQIYENEPWHYELRPDAIDHGCPRMYADPTQDPRMQQ